MHPPQLENPRDFTAAKINKILQKLQRYNVPSQLLLLITPSSSQQITPSSSHRYKLHAIDSVYKNYLGVTSISHSEMTQIKDNPAFVPYTIVVASKYINLQSNAVKVALIENLASMANGRLNQCVRPIPGNAFTMSHSHLEELIERITTACRPCFCDLREFFDLVEQHKFRTYIRPDFSWKNVTETISHCKLPRFKVECFMLLGKYVGGIPIDVDHLELQLQTHPTLLESVHIVSEVYDIIPLPRFFVGCLRMLSDWIGLEILFDAFGEYVFDLYNQGFRRDR